MIFFLLVNFFGTPCICHILLALFPALSDPPIYVSLYCSDFATADLSAGKHPLPEIITSVEVSCKQGATAPNYPLENGDYPIENGDLK